jgi:hypothetical protein
MKKVMFLAVLVLAISTSAFAQRFTNAGLNGIVQKMISDVGGVGVRCPQTLIDSQGEHICFEVDRDFASFRTLWDAFITVNARDNLSVDRAWQKSDTGNRYTRTYIYGSDILFIAYIVLPKGGLVWLASTSRGGAATPSPDIRASSPSNTQRPARAVTNVVYIVLADIARAYSWEGQRNGSLLRISGMGSWVELTIGSTSVSHSIRGLITLDAPPFEYQGAILISLRTLEALGCKGSLSGSGSNSWVTVTCGQGGALTVDPIVWR